MLMSIHPYLVLAGTEHLEKLFSGSEKPSGGIGKARLRGLRDKGASSVELGSFRKS